jgi:hypothetical protein
MSSILRSLSQIPVRAKFLIATAASVRGNADADSSVISLTGGFDSIMLAADVNSNFAATDFSQGALFRDLGRQVMVVDAAGAHLALYREAMPQASAANEGINYSNPSVWLRVWAADGTAVRVARLG